MTNEIVHHASDSPQHALSTPSEKDVPSSEWASSILKALGPITTEPYPPDKAYNTQSNYASVPATPGEKIPGAYPRGPIDPSVISQDVDYVKEAAAHALETAKEYAHSAGEVVGGYLPKSVAALLPHNNSPTQNRHINEPEDPESEELPGPHGEFLGDAQVPDDVETIPTRHLSERRPEDNTLLAHDTETSGISFLNVDDQQSTATSSRFQGASENASTRTLPGSRAEPWRHTPGTSFRGSSRRDSMKNIEEFDRPPSASGVILATQDSEKNMDDIEARKDDQEAQDSLQLHPADTTPVNPSPVAEFSAGSSSASPHSNSHTTAVSERPTSVDDRKELPSSSKPSTHHYFAGSNSATPGHEISESPVGKATSTERSGDVVGEATQVAEHADVAPTTGKKAEAGSAGDMKNAPSLAADSHKPLAVTSDHAGQHPPPTNAASTYVSPAHTTSTKEVPSTSANQTSTTNANPTTTTGATSTTTNTPSKSKFGSTNGKPGFMDKLRGEIKILSGRLEHSNDKIEEGRRLMGKAPKLKN